MASLPGLRSCSTPHLVSGVMTEQLDSLIEAVEHGINVIEHGTHGARRKTVKREPVADGASRLPLVDTGPVVEKSQLRLPAYCGDVAWEAYEAKLAIAIEHAGWSDADAAKFLALALEGAALQVLAEMPEECRRDLRELKDALRGRFGRQPAQPAAKQMLSVRRRGRGEDIGKLAAEVALLVRLAYPSFSRAAQEQLTLDFFTNALEPGELRRHVLLAAPGSVKLAVAEAERAELIFVLHGDDRGAVRAEAAPRRASRRRGACWQCGEPGHRLAECTRAASSGNGAGASQ